MKKPVKLIILLLLIVFPTGCKSFDANKALGVIPAIDADRFEYNRNSPTSSTSIAATGVKTIGDEIKVQEAIVNTNLPFVGSVTVKVENYTRQKPNSLD